jgi:hypothetical protein
MPYRTGFITGGPIEEKLEHLRQGTREQYESDWTLIESLGTHVFTHDLEEIPVVVDVIRSETSDGKAPVDTNADFDNAPVKTSTSITVDVTGVGTVNGVSDFYYKVRAF